MNYLVQFPDGTFVTKDRDFYGSGSRVYSPNEIYESRGFTAMRFSSLMNAQNCAWYVGHGAKPQCATKPQCDEH